MLNQLHKYYLIFSYYPYLYNKKKIIRTLIRQASRWSLAAAQDENVLVAVLHANYGAGYLWAMKDIANSEQIKDATGVNIDEFTKKIVAIQDDATRKLAQKCPEYVGDHDKYLAIIAQHNL